MRGALQAIPPTILQFVVLEHGADIKSQLRFGASKTDVAIAQAKYCSTVYTQTRQRTWTMASVFHMTLEISAQLGDATVSKYVEDGVVCPTGLRKGLFTTSAMDNIDHNPTATTATTSFHGTSISVFQHPTKESKGEEHGQLKCRE